MENRDVNTRNDDDVDDNYGDDNDDNDDDGKRITDSDERFDGKKGTACKDQENGEFVYPFGPNLHTWIYPLSRPRQVLSIL